MIADERATALRARLFPVEAEEAYLGMLLLAPTLFADFGALVRVEDLSREHHRHLYAAMGAVQARGHIPDVGLVMDELESRGQVQQLGRWGLGELARLVNEAPSPDRLRGYAVRIREAAARRALIGIGRRLQGLGESTETAAEALRHALETVTALRERLAAPVPRVYPGQEDWVTVPIEPTRSDRGVLPLA